MEVKDSAKLGGKGTEVELAEVEEEFLAENLLVEESSSFSSSLNGRGVVAGGRPIIPKSSFPKFPLASNVLKSAGVVNGGGSKTREVSCSTEFNLKSDSI